MRCDICNDRDAVICVEQVIMGRQAQVHLCEACAHERGLHTGGDHIGMSVQNFIAEIKAATDLIQQQLDPRACPVCGTGIYHIRKYHSVGCPECYNFFRTDIKDIMGHVGIMGHYSGSVPLRLAQFRSALSERKQLQQKLDECLSIEDYEGAALYRDQLKKLERKGEAQTEQVLAATEGGLA